MNRILLCPALAGLLSMAQAGPVVLSTDFDSSVPAQIAPGAASVAAVQGYAGLGPAGNPFGGKFLRSPTGNVVTISLDNLPAHSTLSLGFLFAAIDSLDGTGTYPQGDFLRVKLDGVEIFRESFANADPGQVQSYIPALGVLLARRIDLGFSQGYYYNDSAYNMAAEPRFQNLPHTLPTATVTFEIEGPGIQPLDDESWAMDNLRITLDAAACPGDLNNDGFVDDSDFVLFVSSYNILDCADPAMPSGCPADLNGDNAVDDADFVIFVGAYNELLCP
ncbi:MAG: hypothetical protein U0570_04190 [Phycisphaerales bacterium]